jgi:hypothetical protein
LARDVVHQRDGAVIFDIMDTIVDLGRLTAAPPGVPEARLAVLRNAFNRVMHDPDFLREAEDLHLSIAPANGREVSTRLEQIFGLDEPYRSFMREAISGSLDTAM